MSIRTYGSLHEKTFRSKAIGAVVEYWNDNKTLTKKFGQINKQKVYVVWQVSVIQNSRALLGVQADGDGYYFEATWNGEDKELYLDVYKKRKHIVIEG